MMLSLTIKCVKLFNQMIEKKYLDKILKQGAKQAQKIAKKNMQEFKSKVGLIEP